MTNNARLVPLLIGITFAPVSAQTGFNFPQETRKLSSTIVSEYTKCTSPTICLPYRDLEDPARPDPDPGECQTPGCLDNPRCRGACSAQPEDPECYFDPRTGKGKMSARVQGNSVRVKVALRGLAPSCNWSHLVLSPASRMTTLHCSNESPCTHVDYSSYFDYGSNGFICAWEYAGPVPDNRCIGIGAYPHDPQESAAYCSKLKLSDGTSHCVSTWPGTCTVIDGKCRMSFKTEDEAQLAWLLPQRQSNVEAYSATLMRFDEWLYGRRAFTAGAFVPARLGQGQSANQQLQHPRTADKASVSVVVGYRTCAHPPYGSSDCAPEVRNDPGCGFLPGGSGSGELRVRRGDVAMTVKAAGISCEGEVLCLTGSERVTTTDGIDCPPDRFPRGCTAIDEEHELVGVGDWDFTSHTHGSGCCTVTNGVCKIKTAANTLRPGLIKPDAMSSGMFFKSGLVRVNQFDPDHPKREAKKVIQYDYPDEPGGADSDPAFLIGLYLP